MFLRKSHQCILNCAMLDPRRHYTSRLGKTIN
jgi:hypothetical protein